MGVHSHGSGFVVRIEYTEPEFQRRTPGAPAFYTAVFDHPEAATRDEAIRSALAGWSFCTAHSGVGWRRVIRSIRVRRRAKPAGRQRLAPGPDRRI